MIGAEEDSTLRVGASSAVKLPQGAALQYVEHSGAAIGAGQSALEKLEEQMIQTGAELLVQRPGQRTATESSNDAEASRSELLRIVENFEDSLDLALQKYDPEARKQLFQAVASATRLIRDDARKSVSGLPVPTGWRNQQGMPTGEGSWQKRQLTRGGKGWPPFEPNNVKKLIKSYMGKRRVAKGSIITTRGIVVNASGEGVIYEFAKRSHRSKRYPWVNSVPFINHLGSMQGGRIIWAAGERRKEEVRGQILDALDVANGKLQSAWDSVKEGDR